MNLAVEAPLWLALLLGFLLVVAAIEDAVRLTISNSLSGLILIAGIVAAVVTGPELALWENLVVFVAILLVGTPLFAAGVLGGGDVKLLACTGLWFNLFGALHMLVAVSIAGGALTLLLLLIRLVGWSEGARSRIRLLQPGSGIPYGVAVAIGAAVSIVMQRGG